MKTLLAFLLLTAPAQAYDICAKQNMPSIHVQTPTVRTDVVIAPNAQIKAWCHKDPAMTAILNGCTFQAQDMPNRHALVILNADLDQRDAVCVLTYEFAHLPPNNWQDPVMEATAPNDPAVAR